MMNRFCRRIFKEILIIITAISPVAQCQISLQTEITAKFTRYVHDFPWEEVYLHTDRDEYISGEEMWFNSYVIDRQSNKLSDASRIVYVELLNSSNMAISLKRVEVKNGSGQGEIYIPDTLSTGSYTLRAYTNYMKNFLPENCFVRELNIYNAITERNTETVTGRTTINKIKLPESVSHNSDGIAGFRVELVKHNNDTLEFLIRTDEKYRSTNPGASLIFIQTRGNINYVSGLNLTTGETRYIVPAKLLTPGINQITFFNSAGQPVAERYIYTAGDEDISFAVVNGENFGRREKVVIDFDFQGKPGGTAGYANLSLSAILFTGAEYSPDLKKFLVFGSEYGYVPEEIVYSGSAMAESSAIKDFLSVSDSRWINWENILEGKRKVLSFQSEKNEQILAGRLIRKDSELPVKFEYLFLSTPGKKAVFRYAKTDKDGRFSFSVPVTEAINDIIIQPEIVNNNYSIEINSPFADIRQPDKTIVELKEDSIPVYIKRWGTNYQVNRIYGIISTKSDEKPPVKVPDPIRFYGKPDIELKMDDYIKLPVMEEVFFELLPGVSIKTRRSKTEISLIGSQEYTTYSKPPVLMIDGVIIKDAAIIANLDPEVVEKIDVIKERYIVGDYIFYGLVNVITRAGDYSHVTLPDYAMRLRYRIFDPCLSFMSADYTSGKTGPDKIPDFRNTLYWNPSVKPSLNGKVSAEFWTSDLPGDYEINIQGFTADGNPVSFKKIIKVN